MRPTNLPSDQRINGDKSKLLDGPGSIDWTGSMTVSFSKVMDRIGRIAV
jgi:hypothetical protein